MSIGENIRRLREKHGLTQKELGAIAGVSDKAVSTWELGLKAPRMTAVAKIAGYFGIPNSAVLDDLPPTPSAFAAAFDRLCRAWDYTPERVARDLQFSQQRLLELRRGLASPTEQELQAFESYFLAPRDVLLGNVVLPEPSNVTPLPASYNAVRFRDDGCKITPLLPRRRVPVLGRVPAGVPLEAVTDIIEEIELDPDYASDGYEYFGLLVTGDSMYPEYRDGDIVILRVQESAETGDDVVAYIGGSDATHKRLTRTDSGIQLRPLNPDYPIRSYTNHDVRTLPVTIAGIVVEQRRRRRR